jgi:hypothetical protein
MGTQNEPAAVQQRNADMNKRTSIMFAALLLAPLVCLSSAQAQQPRKPAKAGEDKAIAKAINAPVEKDPISLGSDHNVH